MIQPQKRRAIALLFIASICVIFSAVCQAQYLRGDKSFGVRAGYESRNESALAGVAFEYTLSRHVRLAPEIDIIFRHAGRDGASFAVNMHFPFQIKGDVMAVYPIAGLAYRSWGIHGKDYSTMKDVTTRRNVFGLNAGCGWEYMLTSTCKLSLEAIYALQRHYPGAEIVAGVSFVF